MKTKLKTILFLGCLIAVSIRANAQGYIVPNGVDTNTFPGEINVWNSSGNQATTFMLTPIDKQQPTVYTNVFSFSEPVTIGVRVFLVQSNDAISLQPILSQSWTELGNAPSYVFGNGVPFYVGLYTGASIAPPGAFFPPYTYNDPVFGWALLVNNRGNIQVLDYAVEYGGAGIYAGTQNIIPVPEPGVLGLFGLGGALLGLRRRKK